MRAILQWLLVTLLAVRAVGTDAATAEAPVRLQLPAGVEVERCHINYFMAGRFGGYGTYIRAKREAPAYLINVVERGAVARTLKLLVACPGFYVRTYTFDQLPPPEARSITVTLQVQPTVQFVGRINGWTQQQAESRVDIQYLPTWTCSFFGLPDCMLVPWTLASVPIGADGRFAANLPDLTQDPVTQTERPWPRLSLRFSIRDQATHNPLYSLNPVGGVLAHGEVAVQTGYPEVQLFELEEAAR